MNSNESKLVMVNEADDDHLFVEHDSVASTEDGAGDVVLAKDETKMVYRFRIILLVVLLMTAVIVSVTAYILSANAQADDFEINFESQATRIIAAFSEESADKLTSIISIAIQLTSHASLTNETWPFVTLTDFEMKARLVLQLAKVVGLFVLPLVTRENLDAWSTYSMANQAWYWEGMELQAEMTGINASTEIEEITPDVLVFSNGTKHMITDEEGPFFPVWQYTPQIPASVINNDFRTLPNARGVLDAYLENDARRNLAGPSFKYEEGSRGGAIINLLLEHWKGAGNQYEGGPLTYYYIPIYDQHEPPAKLVGVLQAFIYWKAYFENVLPEHTNGIVVVLENTCNQNFTFRLSGSRAQFIGDGDLHDTTYDSLEQSTDYGVFLQRSPDDIHGDTKGCFYRLRVYPSKEMEDDYVTNQPIIVGLSIMGAFVFTILVFILYDRFVEKRQMLVMKTAKQTSDVVNKLFPEGVRERLYNSDTKERDAGTTQGWNTSRLGNGAVEHTTQSGNNGCSPIADEYPHCTVFFADLAGFTKWSSTRTPSEVFLLLETLYGAFDKVAKRLGVFKVETIGDCYVAVTGLPAPQENHAFIMTKFAANCMARMNQIINSENILVTLGDDTAKLEMRVGMHSGPVTAGVLRGEKARFQLFGDTVNTASRMESNGQKGRIQVSQTTADLLKAAGKEQWLTAREELVEAKGKGKMQTYWVDVISTSDRASATTGSMGESHSTNDNVLLKLRQEKSKDLQEVDLPTMESARDRLDV